MQSCLSKNFNLQCWQNLKISSSFTQSIPCFLTHLYSLTHSLSGIASRKAMRGQPAPRHSTIVIKIAQKANDPMWASQHTGLFYNVIVYNIGTLVSSQMSKYTNTTVQWSLIGNMEARGACACIINLHHNDLIQHWHLFTNYATTTGLKQELTHALQQYSNSFVHDGTIKQITW